MDRYQQVLVCVGVFLGIGWIYNASAIQSDNRSAVEYKNGGLNDCLSRVENVRGIQLYSQNDEDGALLQILRCMGGHRSKEYFEFGSETGVHVNTRILRDLYGWQGHLLDGGHEDPSIPLHKEYFTPSNIVSLLQKYEVGKNLDVLSVDADYDDLYITREILVAGYRPRVLINEYTINFGSDWSVSTIAKPIGKEGEVGFNHNCYFGASAKAITSLVQAFGYTPVFSNDVNLMFVRLDQATELAMVIPSIDNFPGPALPKAQHKNCSGEKWKLIDLENVQTKAIDPTISHSTFAESFKDVVLTSKEYGGVKIKWRIFQESKDQNTGS